MFDDEQITLSGTVASQGEADRLVQFATNYGRSPSTVNSQLIVAPTAPASAGVRIVDTTAVQFTGESEVITPEHAQQLDRIVFVMTASPELRLHVVGNTDLNGDETRNLVISQRRADAVVNYLVINGIDRSRLTTQPAGESNPISTEPTAEAAALNRRIDFVLYGLLAG